MFVEGAPYLRAVERVENVVLRWVPRPVITGMIASIIPEAMRPYSMAVAAESSFRKAMSVRRVTHL
jgi:hypothetical protein